MKEKLNNLINLISEHHKEVGNSKSSSGSFSLNHDMVNNKWSWTYGGYDTGSMNRHSFSEDEFDTIEEAIDNLYQTISINIDL